MDNIYTELKKIYQQKEVVIGEDLDLILETIVNHIDGLSKLTRISIDYYLDIIKKIDYIRFSSSDPDILKLNIDDRNCRSYHFYVNNHSGIVINEKNTCYRQYDLTHELDHFFIINYVNNSLLVSRDLHIDEKNSRLYEGIVEFITQSVWNLLEPTKESIGEKESRYFFEIQIASILIDTMGKEKFLETIIKNPNILFDKISSISYKDDNLLNYIDKNMKPLIKYRGEYDIEEINSNSILDSFEGIVVCNKMLKLEKKGGINEN